MAVRVHELAKEFGVPSKVILSTLSDLGEYVKSASSTVEAPVIRRLKEEHGDELSKLGAKSAPAKKAPAKKAAAAAPAEPVVEAVETPVVEAPAPLVEAPAPVVEAPPAPEAPTEPSAPTPSPTMGRPGPRPGGARPGNNPFSSRQGMQQERAPLGCVRRPLAPAPVRAVGEHEAQLTVIRPSQPISPFAPRALPRFIAHTRRSDFWTGIGRSSLPPSGLPLARTCPDLPG